MNATFGTSRGSTRLLQLVGARGAMLGASLAALGAAGCMDSGDNGPKGFEIAVAPLTLPGVSDACYSLTVYNSTTTFDATTTVWSQPVVCASQYGDGIGSISYVGTCDASVPENTVELKLAVLFTGGSAFSAPFGTPLSNGTDYVNPCTSADPEHTCRLIRECNENEDTLVEFNLAIMRSAKQGFFDIAVNFEDVFCSAKADCEDPDGDSLDLLFNGAERDSTAVLAFACTAGENADTHLYLSDTYIICDDTTNTTNTTTTPGRQVVARLSPSKGPGNVASPIADQGLFGYANYEGKEDLGAYNKAYWNQAIGFDDTFFYGCPAGYVHQNGACVTCPQPENEPWKNAIKGQCGFCPVDSVYLNGTCMGCANGQTLQPENLKCGGNGFDWSDAIEVAAIDTEPGISIPLDPNTPRACYAYRWASASDVVWPVLGTPADTTYPTILYRVPLNPPAQGQTVASANLSCGANPLDGASGNVKSQYTSVTVPACFENMLSADWTDPDTDVSTDHFSQVSWFGVDNFIEPMVDRVPMCETVWGANVPKGAAPANQDEPAGAFAISVFDDQNENKIQDPGEVLVDNVEFSLVTQAYLAWSAILVGGNSPNIDVRMTAGGVPLVYSGIESGNYVLRITAKPNHMGAGPTVPCQHYTFTTTPPPASYTNANPPPGPGGTSGAWADYVTVGSPVARDEVLIGVKCLD